MQQKGLSSGNYAISLDKKSTSNKTLSYTVISHEIQYKYFKLLLFSTDWINNENFFYCWNFLSIMLFIKINKLHKFCIISEAHNVALPSLRVILYLRTWWCNIGQCLFPWPFYRWWWSKFADKLRLCSLFTGHDILILSC